MFLSEAEKNNILRRFPDFELSYEKLIYKKVSADMFVVIPKGRKFLAWFTYYKENNVCILMELLGRRMVFKSMEIVSSCFESELSFGTIFYGTMIHFNENGDDRNQRRFFSVENIYYSGGKNCSKLVFSEKLRILKFIFREKLSNTDLQKIM